MRMLVLGAGLQGCACAFDLLNDAQVAEVTIADIKTSDLPAFLTPFLGGRLKVMRLDVRDRGAVLAAMRGHNAVMSAIPYYYNYELAETSIEAGAHFSDLGGNTEIVFKQKALDEKARAKQLSVIPDCGVAPGMVNILAEYAIEQLDTVDAVKIYVGGLPQHPEPPLNYQIVYSLEGVLDYYTTLSWVLRNGKRTQVKALSEIESVEFPSPVGMLEAFHTAGGLSTMAFRYEGKIPSMEYKTLRYPGHAKIMEGIRELGLLDLQPVEVRGQQVIPRDVAVAAMNPRLTKKDSPDLVAIRVEARGKRGGTPHRVGWETVDRYDAKHGVSAMMRTTGYSLSLTGLFQVRGMVKGTGVRTPDEAMPAQPYIDALAARGVVLKPLA